MFGCGAAMKIASFIKDAPVTEKILKHPRLWKTEHPGTPLPETRYGDMIEYQHQPTDAGWDDHKEPSIMLNQLSQLPDVEPVRIKAVK